MEEEQKGPFEEFFFKNLQNVKCGQVTTKCKKKKKTCTWVSEQTHT